MPDIKPISFLLIILFNISCKAQGGIIVSSSRRRTYLLALVRYSDISLWIFE